MIPATKRSSPHPMMLAAGIALILFCAVGISAVLGWIPSSMGRNTDSAEVAQATPATAAEKPHRTASAVKTVAAPIRVASVASNVRAICANCGTVESIRPIEARGAGSGMGALGGALAGNQIEQQVRSTASYEIVVRMDNGSEQIIHEANQPAWRHGDHVKVINGVIRST